MLLPFVVSAASADYFLKLDGIDGETKLLLESSSKVSVSGAVTVESGKILLDGVVVLDASSSAGTSAVSRYLWRQTGGPTVTISNAATAKATFVPKVPGTYVFELVITDATGKGTVARRLELTAVSKSDLVVTVEPTPITPIFLEIEDIKGESEEDEKGNVEMEWKVEEGEKGAPGVEPDEIDYDESVELMTNFAILLGGSDDTDEEDPKDEEEQAQGLERAAEVLLVNAQASEQAIESISLNFEKISTRVKHEVKLFGVIPSQAKATVEIDADGKVTVKFPWWVAFASGKDSDALGDKIVEVLSDVLKAHHDTIKNAIGNIR